MGCGSSRYLPDDAPQKSTTDGAQKTTCAEVDKCSYFSTDADQIDGKLKPNGHNYIVKVENCSTESTAEPDYSPTRENESGSMDCHRSLSEGSAQSVHRIVSFNDGNCDGSREGLHEDRNPETSTDLKRRMKRSNSLCSVSSEMSLSRVAAGHGGVSILRFVDQDDDDPDCPKCVMKVYDEREACVYKELEETGDKLQAFAARFYGEVAQEDIPEDLEEGSRYMKLSNLLRDFGTDPHVMDCKIGIRSFVEDEVRSEKLRKDLYLRMCAIDASASTDAENQAQAITKHRWMSFNDSITTTAKLGVRIDGISNSVGHIPKSALKLVKNATDISKSIVGHFFYGHDRGDASIAAASVLQRLQSIKDAFITSAFASRHSFVGMSLLFVVESCGPSAGVYLIDFAKTFPLPDGVAIDHRKLWASGNHEDGFLTGIDTLIQCWEQVVVQFSASEQKGAINSLPGSIR